MSVEALAVVLHHSRAKGTAKLVLLGIANHQGDGGAWPSLATLANYANVTPRNVRKALETLRGMGEVRVDVQGGGLLDHDDHMRPNRFDVLVACPPWCDRTANHRDTRRRSGRQVALPVDKPPVGIDPPSRNEADPRSESTGAPRSDATPEPSIEPDPKPVSASTTDRATADDRPPAPANPPADELAAVRERLHQATIEHTRKETHS